MTSIKPSLSILILISVLSLQFTQAQKFDFTEITKNDLKKTESTIDSTAGVEILEFHKDVYFDVRAHSVNLITKVYKKIKFYNTRSEDLNYAITKMSLYHESGLREKVYNIEGVTYNLIDGKIIKAKLEKSQIFETEKNKYYDQIVFTQPQINKGSIIEVSYKVVSPIFWEIDEFEFQFDIPAKKVTAEIRTPTYFVFNQIPKGNVKPNYEYEEKKDLRVNGKVDVYRYSVEDVPPLKEEKYVGNINNYKSGVLFELVSMKYRDGSQKKYAKSWNDVAATVAFSDDYKSDINRVRHFKDDIDLIKSATTDSLQRMKMIFKFVKENIAWNHYTGKYFDKGMKDALSEKEGNVADINLTLTSMLRYAGLEANPVVISTRGNLKPFYPTVDRLNYVIAHVRLNDTSYVLDATDKFSQPNVMPIRVYNWNGVFMDNDNKKWGLINIQQPPMANKIQFVNVELDENGDAKGKVKETLDNHYAYLLRKEYSNTSQEKYIQEKESEQRNMFIENFKIENLESDEELSESYMFTLENSFDAVGNKIFLNPLLFLSSKNNPFKSKKRNYPVDFIYPFSDQLVVNIKIPEGYKVESMPKPIRLAFAGSTGRYEYALSGSGQYLRLNINFKMQDSEIDADQYAFLREFYKQMTAKQQEQIVLTKI